MAEYIEREALIEKLKYKIPLSPYPPNEAVGGIIEAINTIYNQPTADVVPKSEVENLKVLLEMQENAYESLKELYDMDTEALIKAREKTEVEVAREIFEEIEKILNDDRINRRLAERGLYFVQNGEPTFEQRFAELKKKYTGDKE